MIEERDEAEKVIWGKDKVSSLLSDRVRVIYFPVVLIWKKTFILNFTNEIYVLRIYFH